MSTVARARLRLLGLYLGCAALLFWALAPIYWLLVSSISSRIDLYAHCIPEPRPGIRFADMMHRDHLFMGVNNAFGIEEAEGKFGIVAGSTHGD